MCLLRHGGAAESNISLFPAPDLGFSYTTVYRVAQKTQEKKKKHPASGSAVDWNTWLITETERDRPDWLELTLGSGRNNHRPLQWGKGSLKQDRRGLVKKSKKRKNFPLTCISDTLSLPTPFSVLCELQPFHQFEVNLGGALVPVST